MKNRLSSSKYLRKSLNFNNWLIKIYSTDFYYFYVLILKILKIVYIKFSWRYCFNITWYAFLTTNNLLFVKEISSRLKFKYLKKKCLWILVTFFLVCIKNYLKKIYSSLIASKKLWSTYYNEQNLKSSKVPKVYYRKNSRTSLKILSSLIAIISR